ncbi:hypothetical protein AgCh_030409 [Apium graveolens]
MESKGKELITDEGKKKLNYSNTSIDSFISDQNEYRRCRGFDPSLALHELRLYRIEYFRYVATELASDVVISVGDVKFYLHKSARLQKLVGIVDEGMLIKLTFMIFHVALLPLKYAQSSVMFKHFSKLERFQSTKSLLPLFEELKLASKASVDVATGPIPITGKNCKRKMGMTSTTMGLEVGEMVKDKLPVELVSNLRRLLMGELKWKAAMRFKKEVGDFIRSFEVDGGNADRWIPC